MSNSLRGGAFFLPNVIVIASTLTALQTLGIDYGVPDDGRGIRRGAPADSGHRC